MTRRELGNISVTHIESTHRHVVLMGKFEFDAPEYVHTGLGNITFEGNIYEGVGTFAGFSGLSESESILPSAVQVSLSGLATEFFDEALSAANFGDKVTLYVGYRNDDGTLIEDPWTFYKGTVEAGGVVRGEKENTVSFTLQHVLAILQQNIGTKFTDEDQQRKYPGDLGFQYVEQMRTRRGVWGAQSPGEKVNSGPEYRGTHGGGNQNSGQHG